MTVIAFEGLDGSGKSTVAPLVAARLGARYVPMPPVELALIDDGLFRRQRSRARYLHYLAGVASVEETLQGREVVVCDRHLASAHALHVDVDEPMRHALEALPLPPPDVTVVLEVAEPERRARLAARPRELDPFERRLLEDDALRARVHARMLADPNVAVVATDGRTVAEVVDASLKVIAQLTGLRRDRASEAPSPPPSADDNRRCQWLG